MQQQTKTCRCGTKYTLSSKTQRRMCPECKREYYRNWHATRKNERNEYQRQYYKNNKTSKKEWVKKSRQNSLRCYLYRLLERAKRSRHRCTISADDLFKIWTNQSGKCAVTGLEMSRKVHHLKSCSLDRKNSQLGYELNNVWLVCKWINLAKNNHSDNELRTVLIELINKGELWSGNEVHNYSGYGG